MLGGTIIIVYNNYLLSLFIIIIYPPGYGDGGGGGGGGHHHGRVQIKVYRGATKESGGDKKGKDKETFAPWGYWLKQPADDHKGHGHY